MTELEIIDDFEDALMAGNEPKVGEFVERLCDHDGRHQLLLDLIDVEMRFRIIFLQEAVSLSEYRKAFAAIRGDEWSELLLNKHLYECIVFEASGQTPTVPDGAHSMPAPVVPGYDPLEEIGKGAMGVVYSAVLTGTSRRDAFKIPHPKVLEKLGLRATVWKEAQLGKRIVNDNVCQIYGVFFLYDAKRPRPCIRMKYIPGDNLNTWAQKNQSITLEQIAAKTAQVCRGVQAIHNGGLFHRDLKPENVIVDKENDRAVVIDFGMAEDCASDNHDLCGTPVYMAPEQLPKDIRPFDIKVSERTDVYAIGALLFTLVEGRLPYPGSSREEVFSHILRGPPEFTMEKWKCRTPGLWAIARQAMATNPKDRYASASSMALDLDRFFKGEIPEVHKARVSERAWHCLRKNKNGIYVAILAISLACVLGVLGLIGYQKFRRERLVAEIESLLKTDEKRTLSASQSAQIERHLLALSTNHQSTANDQRRKYVERLVADIEAMLEMDQENALNASEMSQIEAHLATLSKTHQPTAKDQRQKYVARLIGVDESPDTIHLLPRILKQIRHEVTILTASDSATRRDLLVAWDNFYPKALSYQQSSSYYSFLRHDPHRIANLEHLVGIDDCLREGGTSITAEVELFRAYFARGEQHDLDRARVIARKVLERDLSPAWRMVILREYVWLEISSGSEMQINDALALVDRALPNNQSTDSVYMSLLVEKARLFAAKNRDGEAQQILEKYFKYFDANQLELESEALDEKLGDRPARDHLPGRYFLDACLLQGFLLERRLVNQSKLNWNEIQEVWSKLHNKVRLKHVGAYYEGAMLASLAGQLEKPDAIRMVAYTATGARHLGESLALTELKLLIGQDSPSFPMDLTELPNVYRKFSTTTEVITSILKDTWVSERGRRYASQIAFRQIPFKKYSRVQIQLWLFEGLRRAILGGPAGAASLSEEQDALLWSLVENAFNSFDEGQFTEKQFVQLINIGLKPQQSAEWAKFANSLPSSLRGPLAYVLYQHYMKNHRDEAGAKTFLDTLRIEAPESSPLAKIANLAAED
jgi:predicted Ser/Thr protein kinase